MRATRQCHELAVLAEPATVGQFLDHLGQIELAVNLAHHGGELVAFSLAAQHRERGDDPSLSRVQEAQPAEHGLARGKCWTAPATSSTQQRPIAIPEQRPTFEAVAYSELDGQRRGATRRDEPSRRAVMKRAVTQLLGELESF